MCTAAQMVLEVLAADNDGRLFLALLSALMDTLVSELGGMAWRAAAAAAGSSPGTAAAGAAGAEAAVAAAQEAGVTALAALQAAMRQLAGTCVRNAVAKTAGVAAGPVMAMLAVAAEQLRTTAAATTAAVAPPGSLERVRATAGLSLAQATSAVAAGGLLEGVLATVRLQPPSSQAPLLRALQPATDRLVATLLSASSAAAVSAAEAASGASAMPGSVTAVANIASSALRQAVGYCWARLRLQPALQVSELAPAPAVVAERMAEVATLSAAAGCVGMKPPSGISGVEVASWHPARGTLEALFCGALGVGRIVSTALKGAPPAAVHEALAAHSQGPLYGDMQLLAPGSAGGNGGSVSVSRVAFLLPLAARRRQCYRSFTYCSRAVAAETLAGREASVAASSRAAPATWS
eukprot:XP_001698570.1 predicted protein [Chlamydomonas reinhardtii]